MKLSSALYAAILALGVHANAEAEAEAEAAADPWFFPSPCYPGEPCIQYYKGKAYTFPPATPKRSAAPEPVAEAEVALVARGKPKTTSQRTTSITPTTTPSTPTTSAAATCTPRPRSGTCCCYPRAIGFYNADGTIICRRIWGTVCTGDPSVGGLPVGNPWGPDPCTSSA